MTVLCIFDCGFSIEEADPEMAHLRMEAHYWQWHDKDIERVTS